MHTDSPLGSSWTRSAGPGAPSPCTPALAHGSSWTRTASSTRGSSWTRTASRITAALATAAVALVPTTGAAFASTPVAVVAETATDHVVRALPGQLAAAEAAVLRAGGTVERRMAALETLSVQLTPAGASLVSRDASVASVVLDSAIALASTYDPTADPDSMMNVRTVTGVNAVWSNATGSGVDVALIDSGVAPVEGLDASRVINGPDLSFESQVPELRYLDTYGHGTHMAGIILGRDGTTEPNVGDKTSFMGMAPKSRLVSLKVADARGNSDVTQVLAAIDWVVQHRNSNGMNIKVLNLSFGTDSKQSYLLDPLAQAVEVAWSKGITVITSAGNSGAANGRLTMPAVSPTVIAVGAADSRGTKSNRDDTIPAFSSRGDGVRNPDLVAPGRSVQSLRVPGSYIDEVAGDTGRIDDRFFRGSGTSQAAAVVSGAAALLLSKYPNLTPDQVKRMLVSTASELPAADQQAQGAGMLNLREAFWANPGLAAPSLKPRSTGLGSVDASRGSAKLVLGGVTLTGEKDIFAKPYDSAVQAALRTAGSSWAGGSWNGSSWAGSSWAGSSWAGSSWAGSSWAGSSWAGSSWAGSSWAGATWTGSSWAGSSWAGSSWAGSSWAGSSWAGSSWANGTWASGAWK